MGDTGELESPLLLRIRESIEARRWVEPPSFIVEPDPELAGFTMGGMAEGGGGGSYPGCWTPKSQIGSGHLSGVASESVMNLAILSRWLFPVLAAESNAVAPVPALEELLPPLTRREGEEALARRVGRERSVAEELNAWVNHPERRAGRSVPGTRDGAEIPVGDWCRGVVGGSTMTGESSSKRSDTPESCGCRREAGMGRGEDAVDAREEVEIVGSLEGAMSASAASWSDMDFVLSRVAAFWRNLGSFC